MPGASASGCRRWNTGGRAIVRGLRGPPPPGQRGVLHQVLGLPMLAAVLAGCGGSPGAPGPPPASPPDSPAGSSAPGGSAPPKKAPSAPYCEGSPLDCRIYRSTGGRDSSGELGWLGGQPLEVSDVFANGTWTIGVMTPCNELGVEVEGRRTVGPGPDYRDCQGLPRRGSRLRGMGAGVVQPDRQVGEDRGALVLSNDHGTVEFEDAGPNALQPPPGAASDAEPPAGTARIPRRDSSG